MAKFDSNLIIKPLIYTDVLLILLAIIIIILTSNFITLQTLHPPYLLHPP